MWNKKNAPKPYGSKLRTVLEFQGNAGDGVSFLGEFACVSEHKKDAPLPAVQ